MTSSILYSSMQLGHLSPPGDVGDDREPGDKGGLCTPDLLCLFDLCWSGDPNWKLGRDVEYWTSKGPVGLTGEAGGGLSFSVPLGFGLMLGCWASEKLFFW